MAVLDVDPWTVIKTLLESNMVSPDGTWTPLVNDGWLEHKKMKTFQICLQPTFSMDEAATLDTSERTIQQHYDLILYAPTRAKRWDLYESVKAVLNDPSLTAPTDATGYPGVGSTGVQQVYVQGLGGIDLRWFDEECGPLADESSCKGYRVHITLQTRWQE